MFRPTTPAAIKTIEAIFIAVTGSLKYRIPITATNRIPNPAHIAYAKLKSKRFSAKIKTAREIPIKTKVRTEGIHLENPSDSFIQVTLLTSVRIPNARINHFIDISSFA
jgi:hypothetical protein